jgi:hypothetical protein
MALFNTLEPEVVDTEAQVEVSNAFDELWEQLDNVLPDSREKSLVKTNLQQAALWAQATLEVVEVP